jgi:hypothetical protein
MRYMEEPLEPQPLSLAEGVRVKFVSFYQDEEHAGAIFYFTDGKVLAVDSELGIKLAASSRGLSWHELITLLPFSPKGLDA